MKKLSKYVTVFNYIDKMLIILSAPTGGVSIFPFTPVVGTPVVIASASLTLIFSLTKGMIKKLLSITRNKKNSMIRSLCWLKSKLSRIETLVSQALIDMEKSHEECNTILKEKKKYERMKENVRNVSEKRDK